MTEAALFLAFGTFWFWALVVVGSILLIAFLENDKGFLAFLTLAAAVAAFYFWGSKEAFAAIVRHPWWTLACVGGYFAAGTFWGVTKWWRFVRNNRAKFLEAKALFDENWKDNRELDREGEWAHCVSIGHYEDISFKYRPDPKDHKSLILTWMTYWPWSFLWTLVNDPIRKAFRAIYNGIAGFLKRISDRNFQDIPEPDMDARFRRHEKNRK